MTEQRRRPFYGLVALCAAVAFLAALVVMPRSALGEAGEASGDSPELVSYVDEAFVEASYAEVASDELLAFKEEHAGEQLIGIDVSEWNATIDWESVQDCGIDYAILRCGGSFDASNTCYDDSEFRRNALECERLGIPYGVYFYSSATDIWEAANEAWFTAAQLEGLHPTLPVFIDLEQEWMGSPEYSGLLTEIASSFCQNVELAGYTPGVYASVSWWEHLLIDPCFDEWGKWVAQYDGYCDSEGAEWWQYDYEGEVPGIDWPVDMNVWYV